MAQTLTKKQQAFDKRFTRYICTHLRLRFFGSESLPGSAAAVVAGATVPVAAVAAVAADAADAVAGGPCATYSTVTSADVSMQFVM